MLSFFLFLLSSSSLILHSSCLNIDYSKKDATTLQDIRPISVSLTVEPPQYYEDAAFTLRCTVTPTDLLLPGPPIFYQMYFLLNSSNPERNPDHSDDTQIAFWQIIINEMGENSTVSYSFPDTLEQLGLETVKPVELARFPEFSFQFIPRRFDRGTGQYGCWFRLLNETVWQEDYYSNRWNTEDESQATSAAPTTTTIDPNPTTPNGSQRHLGCKNFALLIYSVILYFVCYSYFIK